MLDLPNPANQLQKYLSVGNKSKASLERHAAADGRLRQRWLLKAKAPTGLGGLVVWGYLKSSVYWICRQLSPACLHRSFFSH